MLVFDTYQVSHRGCLGWSWQGKAGVVKSHGVSQGELVVVEEESSAAESSEDT